MTKSKSTKVKSKALGKRTWYILNIVFTIIYLIWRGFFTLPFGYGMISLVLGLSLFIVEFLGMFEAAIHYFNMNDVEDIPCPDVPEERLPDVDIFVATYNESEELLYKTLNACKYITYPDKSKVHIYLCDDGHRENMKELAQKLGVGYFDREDNKHAKAGNLNNALSKTTSPLIVTLDADMIPNRDFLMKTVPYFVQRDMENEELEEKDRKYMGFVQSPQAFYNPDLFQSNLYSEGRIPNEQDFFYRDVQVARNKSNSVIYGGSNTVLSRKAIEDIGGFYTDSITEDYSTGILLQKKKYICIAIKEVLASGLSATDLKSLISQRVRWARGVIQSNRKLHLWTSRKLTFAQKMNYWASKWYWYSSVKRLIYFLSPLVYALFGYMVVECTLPEVLLFWLPMYISSNISLRMLSNNIRTSKWTGIYETALFPFMIIPVVLETFGITMKKFVTTRKDKELGKNNSNLLYLIPFGVLIALSVIAIIRCLYVAIANNTMGGIVILFWLIFNLYTLVMAAFFVSGRTMMRQSERVPVQVECTLKLETGDVTCVTNDISETGISIILEKPLDISEDELIDIVMETDSYMTDFKAKIVNVSSKENGWKYAFKIEDYNTKYEEFIQIIYDRVPSLPQNLDTSTGSFDDLRINMVRRMKQSKIENRKRPRIYLEANVKDTKGNSYIMSDFNYSYLSLKSDGTSHPEKMDLILPCEKSVTIHCVKENRALVGKTLYKIDYTGNGAVEKKERKMIETWICNR